jgi:hypothetical protein
MTKHATQTKIIDAESDLDAAPFNLLGTILEYNRALAHLQRAVGTFSLLDDESENNPDEFPQES